MSIPIVHLLDDPVDNEQKLWKMLQDLRLALQGPGGPLAGWGFSSGPDGQGNTLIGNGEGVVGCAVREDTKVSLQELTVQSTLNIEPTTGDSWGWSWVGPGPEMYVYVADDELDGGNAFYNNPGNKLLHIVDGVVTEVPKVPPIDATPTNATVAGVSDEPAYLFSSGSSHFLHYVWRNKRVTFTREGVDGVATVWTKFGDRFYCFPNLNLASENIRVYDANAGGLQLFNSTVLEPLALGIGAAQASKNFLWVLGNNGGNSLVWQLKASDLTLVQTIDLGVGGVKWFKVLNDSLIYFIRPDSGGGNSWYELRYWASDGLIRDVDLNIPTTSGLGSGFIGNPWLGFIEGKFYVGAAASKLDILATLTGVGQSAASEIILLGEEGQLTPDNTKLATLDTVKLRVGINTGCPEATLDLRQVLADCPIFAMHTPSENLFIDMHAKNSTVANTRLRSTITTNPATRFVFMTTDSGGTLTERAFIDSDAGVGTPSANYGGFGRAITLQSTTDVGYELASTRSDADAISIGAVSAQYRTNSASHTRIADIQFKSDGSTANQRGGRVVIATKGNGSTVLTGQVFITQAGHVGIGTGTPNYAGFTRAVTVESATDVAMELASSRADADAVGLGFIEANYRTNSVNHNRVANIQFKTDGTTVNQRGGRVVIATKSNGATALTDRLSITESGEVRIASLTTGSVLFSGANGAISQDNANLFWDNTNNRLGLLTPTPQFPIDLEGSVNDNLIFHVSNLSNGTGASSMMIFDNDTGATQRTFFINFGSGNTGSTIAGVARANNTFLLKDGTGHLALVNRGSGALILGATNSETMRLVSDQVTVGTTGAAGGKFHITSSNAAEKKLIVQGAAAQSGNLQDWQNSATTTLLSVDASGHLKFGEATNVIVGTTTGTKIGTATTQKLGFFNATPVTQRTLAAAATDAATTQTLANSLRTALIDLGLGA